MPALNPYKPKFPFRELNCNADDSIVTCKMKVDFMHRDEPKLETDSGWNFCSSVESQNSESPPVWKVFKIGQIIDSDPDILPFLSASCGSEFERDGSGKFVPLKDEWDTKWEARRDVLAPIIIAAFKDVTLEDGISLHEADALDGYGDTKAARLLDTEKSWMEVSLTEHRYNSAPLSFFDPKGFRFYLPAYMLWDLMNPGLSSNIDLVWFLTLPENESSRRLEQYKILNEEQSIAVRKYLEFFLRVGDCDAKIALDRYWRSFG